MTAVDVDAVEERRLLEQERLDSLKTPEERNEWGQYATPGVLARDILRLAKTLWRTEGKVRFIDPAIGTGSFYSALLDVFGRDHVDYADGVELDSGFAEAAKQLWGESGLSVAVDDFTTLAPPPHRKYNLIVANPPYVRHHHMTADYKTALKEAVLRRVQIRTSGLAGLYAFFLLLCDSWLEPDALSLWLIPSEFMDVNYGEALREYLTTKVQLLRIHRFCPSDVQFADALVSSAIVVFRRAAPDSQAPVEMSFGGPLSQPAKTAQVTVAALKAARKWSGFPSTQTRGSDASHQIRLGDLFTSGGDWQQEPTSFSSFPLKKLTRLASQGNSGAPSCPDHDLCSKT
jgi:predicted RNA methylase